MEILETPFDNTYVIFADIHADTRGSLIKPYSRTMLTSLGIDFEPNEVFISNSSAGVIRGMHLPLPPFDGPRLVYCASGSATDVLVDLRPDSRTYLKTYSIALSQNNPLIIYVPPGVAHGFISHLDGTEMVYVVQSEYKVSFDGGVNYKSINFDWGDSNHIVSDRDMALPAVSDWENPYCKSSVKDIDSSGSKILLTGANGFVGSHLLDKLIENGWDCSIIIRQGAVPFFKNRTLYSGIDLHILNDDYSNLEGIIRKVNPDIIIHTAANTFYDLNPTELSNALNGNLLYGTAILEAMRACGVKNLINTGTSWEHLEGSRYRAVNLYASLKYAFQTVCEYYADAHDFKIITLKLFDTYGVNDTRNKLFRLLMQSALSGIPFDMSSGVQEVDIVSIDDVAKAYILATKYFSLNTSFNVQYAVATKTHLKLRQIVEQFICETDLKCIVNFGAKAHRAREIFKPWRPARILPNWAPNKDAFSEFLKDVRKECLGDNA